MRLIDSVALIKEMYHKSFEVSDGRNVWKSGLWIRYQIFEEAIRNAPIIDAVPVRHGKWKQWDSYGFEDTYKCTACGESFVLIEGTPITNGYKYCPNCGARMDGERKEE